MNSLELIKWAEERHVHYCRLGDDMLQNFGKCFEHPKFSLFAKNVRAAGWARYYDEICDYNLVYLLAAKEDYEHTIAHEVAHFVARKLDILAKGHGDLFKFVLKEFSGGRDRYHHYVKSQIHVDMAKAIMLLRKLQRSMLKDAAETEEV